MGRGPNVVGNRLGTDELSQVGAQSAFHIVSRDLPNLRQRLNSSVDVPRQGNLAVELRVRSIVPQVFKDAGK
jgi:hypothetical protein